jgi:hypothetical protein
MDEARGQAWTLRTSCCESWIDQLDVATMTVTKTIMVGTEPDAWAGTSMAISANRDTLYVVAPSRNALAVVVPAGNTPTVFRRIGVFRDSAGETPRLIAIAANGKALISQSRSGGTAFAELDMATGAQRLRPDAAHPDTVEALLTSLEGSALAIVRRGCVQLYDAVTDTFGTCQPRPRGGMVTSDRTGARYAIGRGVYDRTFTLLRTVETVNRPLGAEGGSAIEASGEHVHHWHDMGGWMRSRVSDGALVDRTDGWLNPYLVRMWADGSRMLAVSGNSAGYRVTLVRLDPDSATVVPPAADQVLVSRAGMMGAARRETSRAVLRRPMRGAGEPRRIPKD